MGTFERKPLEGRTIQSESGTGGGCLIVFGIPFLIAGIGMLVVSGALRDFGGPSPEGQPTTLLALMGVAFASSGILVMMVGVRSVARMRRRKRMQAEHPAEPWLWDHKWDSAGAVHSAGKATLAGFVGLIFFTLFLSPFNWFIFAEGAWPAFIIVGIFDLVLVVAWGFWIYQLLQGLKFGNSRLAFLRFPYFLGESLDATLLDTDRLRGMTKLTVTLRCIEEVQTTQNQKTQTKTFSVYEDQTEFDPAGIYFGTGGAAGILKIARKSDPLARLELKFDLPQGDLGTRLFGPESGRYWEIEVLAAMPGVDYEVRFMVPVYSR